MLSLAQANKNRPIPAILSSAKKVSENFLPFAFLSFTALSVAPAMFAAAKEALAIKHILESTWPLCGRTLTAGISISPSKEVIFLSLISEQRRMRINNPRTMHSLKRTGKLSSAKLSAIPISLNKGCVSTSESSSSEYSSAPIIVCLSHFENASSASS